jgi:hypothetical protein
LKRPPGAIALEVAWFLLVRCRSYPWRETLASVDFWRARTWRERFRQLFGRPGDSLAALAATWIPQP